MLRFRAQAGITAASMTLIVGSLIVGSSGSGDPRQVETVGLASTTTTHTSPESDLPDPTTTTDPCDADCELATWQRAVWQAAVWDNAVAANGTTEGTIQGGDSANPQVNPTVHGTESGTEVESIIREVWAGSGLEDWAVSIAWRESRHQPGVVSGEGALGLFQLLGHDDLIVEAAAALGRPADWSDPWVNALAARYLAERSGTCHWDAPNYCAG